MKLTNNKLAQAIQIGLVAGVASIAFAGVASAQDSNTDQTTEKKEETTKSVGKVTVAGKVSKETAEKLEEMRWSRRLPKGAAVEAAIEFWVNNAPAV